MPSLRELNAALQRVLNPTRPGQPAVERFGWRFQVGDKVIQTENDYGKDVFNGTSGSSSISTQSIRTWQCASMIGW